MKTYLHKNWYTNVFFAALFKIAKKVKTAKYPSNDKWINICVISTQWNIIWPKKGMKY